MIYRILHANTPIPYKKAVQTFGSQDLKSHGRTNAHHTPDISHHWLDLRALCYGHNRFYVLFRPLKFLFYYLAGRDRGFLRGPILAFTPNHPQSLEYRLEGSF